MGTQEFMERLKNVTTYQHIQPATGKEPYSVFNEFYLHKPAESEKQNENLIAVEDIVKTLSKSGSKKKIQLGRELSDLKRTGKILPKPLERSVADKIKREIGYNKVKKTLSKWDSVVTKNRHDDHKVFPLENEVHIVNTTEKPKRCIKSELMLQFEAIDNKIKKLNGNDENSFVDKKDEQSLKREQLIMRRKEIAYMKMKEAQQSQKARLRNKIKSKRYHKLLKRDKLTKQIKEIEELKKTEPEKALELMQQIDLSRVQERATLRHKNTGTWAKNSKIRASYDREARKNLAEQVALSKEITQKLEANDDSDEEEEQSGANVDSKDVWNPWVKVSKEKGNQKEEEKSEVLESYRKYWFERNKNEKRKLELQDKEGEDTETSDDDENMEQEVSVTKTPLRNVKKNTKAKKKKATKVKKIGGWIVEDIDSTKTVESDSDEKGSDEEVGDNLDDLFDKAEEVLEKNIDDRLNRLKPVVVQKMQKKKRKNEDEKLPGSNLEFKKIAKYADIDEQLDEMPKKGDKTLPKVSSKIEKIEEPQKKTENVDPNTFVELKPKVVALGDSVAHMADSDEEDDENDDTNKLTIADAFIDDDIIADFSEEAKTKSTETEVDLTLPGWGSWAGCGIVPKQKKLKVNFAKDVENSRKKKTDSNVQISEKAVNPNLKEHLVSDLPFPFQSVKDYEGSIRAPIGRNFVPETAFRKLTKPEVKVKLGKVIEPIDESFLPKIKV